MRSSQNTLAFLLAGFLTFASTAFCEEATASVGGEAALKEIDSFLSNAEMSRLIPRDKMEEIYSLSRREDMEITDNYLVSDELLLLLNRRAVLHGEFGALVEKLQTVADGLPAAERTALLSHWKTLWLEKTSKFVRYAGTLKRKWALTYYNTLDYDTNVRLEPQDSAGSSFSERADTGFSNSASLQLRPFVNRQDLKNWTIETIPSGYMRMQASVKEVQYNVLGLTQVVAYDSPERFITRTQFTFGYERNYSTDPWHRRMQSGQENAALRLQFWPVKFGEKAFFSGSSCKLSASYRGRMDYGDSGLRSNPVSSSPDGFWDQDNDALNFALGQNFSRHGKGRTFQTFGWNMEYEASDTSPSPSKDYHFVSLSLNYSRNIASHYFRNPLSWRTSLSYRDKQKERPKAYDATLDRKKQDLSDETQLSLNTSLRATWSRNWSSSLGLSYAMKNQDLVGGYSGDVNQFRVSWTNTFLTF